MALEILATVSDALSDATDSLKYEHSTMSTDLKRNCEDEQRESTERHLALESTMSNFKTALLEKDHTPHEGSVVESQLRAENARFEENNGHLRKFIIELQCQRELILFENGGLKIALKEKNDKLKQVVVVESQLRTENAVLAEKMRSFCMLDSASQNQIAQNDLTNADLKSVLQEKDEKLKQAAVVESQLRTEIARLEENHAGLCERFEELQKQNTKGNLEIEGLKTILRLRDDALNQASVVEAQLRTDIAQLEEKRGDLTNLVSELQRVAEEIVENAKEDCFLCKEQYSAERPKEVLYRCGHCFCSVCMAREKTAALSRRVGNVPVEFKCPICRAEIFDIIQPINN